MTTLQKRIYFFNKYSSFKRFHDQNVDRNGNWSFGIDTNYISQESSDMFSISIRKNSFIAVNNSKNTRKKNYDSIVRKNNPRNICGIQKKERTQSLNFDQ